MAVGGGGVSALFYVPPITPGDLASWLAPGVLQDGTGGAGFVSQPPFYFANANQTSIITAAAAANVAGGGYVIIPAGTISLTQPLPVYRGVVYEGAPMQAGIGQQSAGVGGTILRATVGTISSGAYNNATGVVTLTMTAPIGFGAGVGVSLYNLTGTGAFASLQGLGINGGGTGAGLNFVTTSASGTAVTFTAPAGLGATTITGGNLTFDGFDYNNADLVTPPSNFNLFIAGMVTGFGIKSLTLNGFGYGIKIGGLYNPGMTSCAFSDVYVLNCQQWGIWFENYNNSTYEDLGGIGCAVGGIARVNSGASLYNGGNSTWIRCGSSSFSNLVRGSVHWTRGASNTTQDADFNEIVTAPHNYSVTQAATMSNASADITVTDATAFPIDMPVTWSASINGFVANQVYFVVASNTNTNIVRVSSRMRDTAITPSGNSAVNILSKGFALKEVSSLDSGSSFTGFQSYGTDLEGSSTMQLLLQQVIGYSIQPSFLSGTTDVYQTVVGRTAQTGILVSMPVRGTVDFDSASLGGTANVRYGGDIIVQNQVQQIASGNVVVSLFPIFNAAGNSWFIGEAGNTSTTGDSNMGMGLGALGGVTTGVNNSAIGKQALTALTVGRGNVGIGTGALFASQSDAENTAIGLVTFLDMITGSFNVGMGSNTGRLLASGSENTFVGNYSGSSITSGSNNTLLGGWQGPAGAISNIIAISNGFNNVNVKIDYGWTNPGTWTSPDPIVITPVVVASLPTAGIAGRRHFVTDATLTVFATIVAGGGANAVPVYDDGANWRIG